MMGSPKWGRRRPGATIRARRAKRVARGGRNANHDSPLDVEWETLRAAGGDALGGRGYLSRRGPFGGREVQGAAALAT